MMDRNEILSWLHETDPTRLERLWRLADDARRRHVGEAVHLRGLVEISNYCVRRCAYCGLREPNRRVGRYRMTDREIFDCAGQAVALGYGTIVMQSGEDPGITQAWMADVIRRIKDATPLAVTLGLGERTAEELAAWRAAGADRYLLKFETSNRALYERIHPPRDDGPVDRMALLGVLRDLGYEVGTGAMIGVPGQTYDDLANDISLFRSLDVDMIGVGPYLPHPETPLATQSDWAETPGGWGKSSGGWGKSSGGWGKAQRCPSLESANGELESGNSESHTQVPPTDIMTYKTIALARLMCPWANIPATTALGTAAGDDALGLALQRGANVVMPCLTPERYRLLYDIYPGRVDPDESPEARAEQIRRRLASIGRRPGQGPGNASRRGAV